MKTQVFNIFEKYYQTHFGSWFSHHKTFIWDKFWTLYIIC